MALDTHIKLFGKHLDRVTTRFGRYELFSDWIEMSACTLFNSIHKSKEVEETYLRVAKQYKKEELERFAALLGITVDALDEEPGDFLGRVYGELELLNKHAGQFFTPDSISKALSQMLVAKLERKPGRVIKIAEPCCGAGGMVISCWLNLKPEDKEWAHFTAQDISVSCFYMTYIQCFLLGISAEVILGNTLAMETRRVWRTFGYYAHGMETKLKANTLLDLLDDMSSIKEMAVNNNVVKKGQVKFNF